MSVPYTEKPWAFLEDYRGKAFKGEWPTLPEMYKITVSRFPERACFTIYEPDRISLNYTEALKIIESIARWLHSKGIKRSDKVAVTGKNAPEWTIAYLGVLFAGATVVPIDYQLKIEEIEILIKTSGAKILFVDEEKYEYFSKTPGKL